MSGSSSTARRPGVPCSDAGNLISYAGNITSTCPGTNWTANSAGGTIPNEVVFSAAPGVIIPAGQATFCAIQFDVHVDAFPVVGQTISQASGFTIPTNDAVCNTRGPPPGRQPEHGRAEHLQLR